MPEAMSLQQARDLVLGSQGLSSKPTSAQRKAGAFGVIEQLGLLQLDSVNVFERAHYMPVFSRIGAFDKSKLDALAEPKKGTGEQATLIEYWAHEAAWIRTEDLPLHRFRMDWYKYGTDDRRYSSRGWDAVLAEHGDLIDWIRAELRAKGPLTIAQIEHDQNRRKGNWWGWSDVKTCLERMFLVGEVVSAGRENFSRRYALADQVLNTATYSRLVEPDPDYEGMVRTLVERAARTDGVATIKDLADFVRLKIDRVAPRVHELVDAGTLTQVSVEGWKDIGFVHRDNLGRLNSAKTSASKVTTLLSPFDPLTRNRERANRIFGFDYKIEIYTPEPKRVFGYYCLPLLHRGQLAGRIDLKSNRQTGQLMVQSAWHEANQSSAAIDELAAELADHLQAAARWQGLSQIVVSEKGNLAPALKAVSNGLS
jgi:uncharacterized protein